MTGKSRKQVGSPENSAAAHPRGRKGKTAGLTPEKSLVGSLKKKSRAKGT